MQMLRRTINEQPGIIDRMMIWLEMGMSYDANKPSIARIYDYWLGGTHNFPIDRAVGEQMAQLVPFVVQALRLNRWFVTYAGSYLAQAGIDHFIDLGAGLPTEGSLHESVPETSKILYDDFDPDAVAYAREILDARPHIEFVQARIEDIDTIVGAAERFFGAQRRVGICMSAVAHFIDDDSLRHVFRRLYDWSAPGSMLAVSSNDADPTDPNQRAAIASYEQRTGARLYLRSAQHLYSLIEPWQPQSGGFHPFEAYAEADLGRLVVQPGFRGRVGYAGFFIRPPYSGSEA
ncbi:MAG TPA: SAM-dependent methyltransferase [Herpetosiphonaceae bacterium]